MPEQPLHPGLRGGLFVAGEHEDEVAGRNEAGALPAHHVGDQHRGAGLVVEGAAAIEPARRLAQHERIVGPVGTHGVDDIQMREQQHGFRGGPGAAQRGNQILTGGRGTGDRHVGGRIARGQQPIGHRAGGAADAAAGRRGVDLDQLLEDLAVPRILVCEGLARARSRPRRRPPGRGGFGMTREGSTACRAPRPRGR